MPPCPTCSSTRKYVFKTSRSVVATFSSCGHLAHPHRSLTKRFASSSTPDGVLKKPSNDFTSPRPESLTLLHKTRALLPRVLESTGTSGSSRTEKTTKLWDSVLSKVHEDLSATNERPAKIFVCGLDEWSEAEELVTALLADVFSSATQNDALRDRWKDDTQEKVSISHGNNINIASSSLQLPSGYLTQFHVPIEIVEFRPPGRSTSSVPQMLESSAIFEADVPIIVCNPLTTSLSTILGAQLPSNTIIVLTSTIIQAELDAIIQQQTSNLQTPRLSTFKVPEVISADPERAMDAIRILQAEPNSFSAIQRYQVDFMGSGLSKITNALQTKLAAKPHIPTIRTDIALSHVSDILQWALSSIHRARQETDKAFVDVSHLRDRIQEARARVEGDVFGGRRHGSDKMVVDEVDEAMKQTEKEMRHVMNGLTWWRMIWRVDDISGIISSALTRSWCRGLESKLIMHTGRLSGLQDSMSQSAFTLLSAHPTISTAVLRNNLLQLKASPNYHLSPDSLTEPLFTRRNQIIEYPTTRLHVTGQRAVLGMTGGILSSVGISWAGWLGWLVGSGEGLLGFVGIDASTAIGVGMLGAVASIRWAIGRWEKSKKRWWQDWARVGEGLDRDLKVCF
ncbi:hypothetical protein BDZ97DRAFT_1989233 [Flammula alnicola]|nr:hypothetical protein BDZ97DRAFT_1989233 [Flammula alnicola]